MQRQRIHVAGIDLIGGEKRLPENRRLGGPGICRLRLE